MAGMKVVVVKTAEDGEIDVEDLRAKIEQYRDELSVLMITYPSTHGVFEEHVADICAQVHEAGGQVYVDGANLNALVGLAKPGHFGGDVSHLNLHKTFCIPHGGGGPVWGRWVCGRIWRRICRTIPSLRLGRRRELGRSRRRPGVCRDSADLLGLRPAHGWGGLKRATQVAVLSANYIAKRLEPHYPVLYTGPGGLVAHECIIDLRPISRATGVSVDDIAKRLIDYGFHAPTMSFPVAGTLMIEPTESEDLIELDRFCEAMIAIRGEIEKVGAGEWPGRTTRCGTLRTLRLRWVGSGRTRIRVRRRCSRRGFRCRQVLAAGSSDRPGVR